MTENFERMASNLRQILKNQQKFIGKIRKRGLGHRQHSWLSNIRNCCNILNAATFCKRAEEGMIRGIVR